MSPQPKRRDPAGTAMTRKPSAKQAPRSREAPPGRTPSLKPGSSVYVVRMELYPNRSEPEALLGVLERFTAEVAYQWSHLVYSSSIGETGLVQRLNQEIYDQFAVPPPGAPSPARSQMDKDIGGATPILISGARGPTSPDAWTTGGGGAHEARATINAKIGIDALGNEIWVPWTFKITTGGVQKSTVAINIVASWFEATVGV